MKAHRPLLYSCAARRLRNAATVCPIWSHSGKGDPLGTRRGGEEALNSADVAVPVGKTNRVPTSWWQHKHIFLTPLRRNMGQNVKSDASPMEMMAESSVARAGARLSRAKPRAEGRGQRQGRQDAPKSNRKGRSAGKRGKDITHTHTHTHTHTKHAQHM